MAAFAVVVVAGFALYPLPARAHHFTSVDPVTGDRPPSTLGGAFTLVDQTGRTVSDRDFRGEFMLIYFGYSRCEDTCPLDLKAMGQAVDLLGDEGNKVRPIFISFDSQRDTPEQLAEYVRQIHPRIIGMTGTRGEIHNVAKIFRVRRQFTVERGKNKKQKKFGFRINHTTRMYLVGPDGVTVDYFYSNLGPKDMAKNIRLGMQEFEKTSVAKRGPAGSHLGKNWATRGSSSSGETIARTVSTSNRPRFGIRVRPRGSFPVLQRESASGLVLLLLGLPIAALLLANGIAFSVRWYEEGRSDRVERSSRNRLLKRALAMLAEMGSQVVLFALLVADSCQSLWRRRWRRHIPAAAVEADQETQERLVESPAGERPVILIHRLGLRALTMYPLARKLRRTGRTVFVRTYKLRGGTLEAYGRQLRDSIEALSNQTGWREFDAVAYSTGGLVLRRYLTVHEGSRRMKRVVTLGTPHGGTELWRFSFLKAVRQLRPGGETLKRLDDAGLPAGVEATAISSDFDQVVIPNGNARWEAPGVHNHVVSVAGHSRLLFHPETFRLVREALS